MLSSLHQKHPHARTNRAGSISTLSSPNPVADEFGRVHFSFFFLLYLFIFYFIEVLSKVVGLQSLFEDNQGKFVPQAVNGHIKFEDGTVLRRVWLRLGGRLFLALSGRFNADTDSCGMVVMGELWGTNCQKRVSIVLHGLELRIQVRMHEEIFPETLDTVSV